MRTLERQPALVACLLGAVLASCSERPELPDIWWSGEHVEFAADHPELVCGGTLEYLDQRTGALLERLGSEQTTIEYYWLDDISDICGDGAKIAGCVREGVAYSRSVPLLHEVVHARSGDLMPGVLEEGLADYIGDPYPLSEMASRERLIELLTSDLDGIDSEAEYARAAHFMAFLSEHHGWAAVLQLDAVLSRNSSVGEVDAGFESVFGMGLDAILAEYESYPDCTGNVDMTLACAEPASASLDFLNTTYERLVDCASVDGIGPHFGRVFVEDVIELGAAIDGSRAVFGMGDGFDKDAFILIRRCGPCTENGVWRIVSRELAFWPEELLPAGRYVVRFYLPVDAGPAIVGLNVTG